MLTQQEEVLEVPGEETLGQLRSRYSSVNAHAESYTWKGFVRTGAALTVAYMAHHQSAPCIAQPMPDPSHM
jgi:hypothetical protein